MLTEESNAITEPPAQPPLSGQQRSAVEHDAGPLIVLAGPGTGKTRVITERIARLVAAGSEPESIVAVTFTVKAARELRERLRALIGPGPADRLNAHTFHGLGWRLIRRFTDYLGLPAEPRIIDSAQTRRLLRSLIRERGLFPELIALGRESIIDEAHNTIGLLANNAVFPAPAAAFARDWSARLDANPDNLDDEALAAEREHARRFDQMAALYRLFAEACAARGWLTLDDLILYPIRLLRDKPPAAAIIRDDYRHFVVDEFQDVNLAQIELLKALVPPQPVPPAAASGGRWSSNDDDPNSLFTTPRPRSRARDLCVVGDDDQSIYEFRGADDRAFARFAALYPGHAVLPLSKNFRSQQPIIDAANALITRAEHRFAPDKIVELADPAKAPAPGAALECLSIDADDRCGQVIAAAILSDRAANPGRPFSAYAAIARTNPELDRIGASLRLEGIPVRLARPPSALDDPGIQDLLKWVALLAAPPADPGGRADYAAQWLLSRPPFSIPAHTLLEWVHSHKAQHSRARVAAHPPSPSGTGVPPVSLSHWLTHHHGDHPTHGPALRRFLDLETDLRQIACHSPAETALFEIIRRADLAHAELLEGRERAARVARLADCLRFVRSRMEALDPPADLAAFWSYYNDLSRDEQQFRSNAEDRIDGPPEDEGADSADAVTLLTAHSAKGLEFDTVFIARARPPHGFPKTSGDERDEIPPGLIDRPGPERSARERALAEERRLFYVACTRARRRLVILAKKQKSRGQSTDYFAELALDPPCCHFAVRRTGADILREAAERGVHFVAPTELDDAAGGLGRENRAELIRRARREARTLAAQALDTTDRPDADPGALDAAAAALRESAQRLAIAAHLERHAELPGWARDGALSAPLRDYAARLESAWNSGLDTRPFLETLFRPLAAPLKLSYSWIKEYHDCPRCFYLRRILRISEPPGEQQLVGVAAHEALKAFYTRARSADAGEGPAPTLDDLLHAGRDAYLAALPSRSAADPEQLARLLAQLRLTHNRLHDPAAEVEQLEFSLRVPYPFRVPLLAGQSPAQQCESPPLHSTPGIQTHTLEAKFDRLDRLPPPRRGHRIIDYKTGRPVKSLLEPRPEDLQLGIYAIALSHHQHSPSPAFPSPAALGGAGGRAEGKAGGGSPPDPLFLPAEGEAQYWLLATGQRSTINLADIDYAAVKQTIDEALAGMLAGDFDRGDRCWDLCTTFARD